MLRLMDYGYHGLLVARKPAQAQALLQNFQPYIANYENMTAMKNEHCERGL